MVVAILMSTFNGEQYLDKQLESIYLSTFSGELNVYIRDDGSTDRTFEIIKKWQDKMSIHLIKGKNVGPAQSFWNLIVDESIQADYYFLCDQDDIWDAEKISTQISCMQGCSEQLSITNCRIIDKNDQVLQQQRVKKITEIKLENLFVCGVAQGCSMAFTYEFANKIRKSRITSIPMHDIILLMYALTNGGVLWIERPLFNYRVHDNNVVASNKKSIKRRITSLIRNWRNGSKNSVDMVAEELLVNNTALSQDEKRFLVLVSNYKSSFFNKLKLAYSNRITWKNPRILFSFRVRVLLGLL